MADLTHQQLLDAIRAEFATKEDLKSGLDGLESRIGALDAKIDSFETRINQKIASASGVSTANRLETRALLGDQVTKLEKIREGLASAGSF